jgi:hypothetical protein
MGARSTGLAPRRGYTIDAATVLVGDVRAGARGRAAATRTGAAQILNTRLEAQDVFKIVVHGQTSTSAGGYIIEVAHVAEGSTTIGTYAAIATVTCAPGVREVAISGAQVRALVAAANSNPADLRAVAIRATAGTKVGETEGNGVLVPAGTNTISLQVAPGS